MKSKIINLGLILSSFIGYLEWGQDKKEFLLSMELEILSKLLIDPIGVIHPMTILPLLGQSILLITLFQKKPNRIASLFSLSCLSLLLLLIFLIGILNLNFKMVLSIIPFLIIGIIAVKFYWKNNLKPA